MTLTTQQAERTMSALGETFELPCYVNRGKSRETLRFRRPLSIAEAAAHCDAHSHCWFVANNGDARQAKINGSVRRWKRDANRIEVPIKYGLYEYATFDSADLMRRLLIEV